MAYLAYYRAFRPSTFDEVVRQEHIVRILKNQIKSDKIGHAYLFCGPRGTGKTSLAKIFARAINCLDPKDGSPCGKCAVCKALADGANMDIVEIDAASNNGVDEMRDLRDKVQYPPVAGSKKVYIIDEVHMLSPSAFNAVLKTLEEPPSHAVFILATTEPQKIPATILSRCMRFDFKLIPQSDLEKLIKSVFDRTGKEYEDSAVSAIARAGAGSARDSLSIADMCASYTAGKLTYNDVSAVLGAADFESVAKIMRAVLSGDASEALALTEKSLSSGKGVGTLCKDMLSFLNSAAIVKMCKNAREIVNLPDDRYALIQQAADCADGHGILRATEILSRCEGDMRYALNGAVTLETAVLKSAMPQTDYNIDALISRISALENKIEEGNFAPPKNFAEVNVPSFGESERDYVKKSAPSRNIAEREEVQTFDQPSPFDAPQSPSTERRTALNDVRTREQVAAQPERQSAAHGVTQPERGANDYKDAVQPALWENAPANPEQAGSLTDAEKSKVFAGLLRLFRTTRRNAVLFTLCMDLESAFEGDKLILYTQTDAVYKALNREENAKFIREALAELNVYSFEVRFKAASEDKWESAERRLKENFKGIDIDIK